MVERQHLAARLLAFEQGRSASDWPLDRELWSYDGERYIVAPHHKPAYSGERIVICEMNGPEEARDKNAFLICQARSAIFWCAAHEDAAVWLANKLKAREEKFALLEAEIADLQRRVSFLPPDILPILEALLEKIGFHFSPDHKTMQLVKEAEAVISQIKKATDTKKVET